MISNSTNECLHDLILHLSEPCYRQLYGSWVIVIRHIFTSSTAIVFSVSPLSERRVTKHTHLRRSIPGQTANPHLHFARYQESSSRYTESRGAFDCRCEYLLHRTVLE